MHPLIAFLSFLFSPTDDWALKKGYQLLMEPQALVETSAGYSGLAKSYPSADADVPTLMTWAEILSENQIPFAQKAWNELAQHPMITPALGDEIRLRRGETAFQNGDLKTAEEMFAQIAATDSPRKADAVANLLLCDLRKNDAAQAKIRAAELKAIVGTESEFPRAAFPLALAAFVNEDHAAALPLFKADADNSRSQYFTGLTLRAMDKPAEALLAWQGIKQKSATGRWTELADYQIAETYFSLGDHALSRKVCETALAAHPENATTDSLVFRLASIDMAEKKYDDALARLALIKNRGTLDGRMTVLMAESYVKTGKHKEVLAMLDDKRAPQASAESQYHLAWAALLSDKHQRAFFEAEKGLENFYDADVTPRLLLLEGIALEKQDETAGAMATYQTIADRFPNSIPAAQATHWLTLAYVRLGRYQEALTHAGYLWNNLSNDNRRAQPDTAFWLGEAALRLGRPREADRHFDSFLTAALPDHELTPYAQFERAAALAQLDKTSEAVVLLAEFSKSAKDIGRKEWEALAHLQRGHIFFNNRQYEPAIAAYRESGTSDKSLFQQGLALHRLDYFTDAIEVWTKLAALHPQSPLAEDGLFRSGRTQFEMGKAAEAVATFAHYIETYPNSPRVKEAMLQSAHALYNAGDMKAAAPLYAAYLQRFRDTEDMVTVTPYLAAAQAQSGKALEEIELAMKGLPPTEIIADLKWQEGAKLYNERKYNEAAAQFSGVLSALPIGEQSRSVLFYRGESLYLAQSWFDAEKTLGHFLANGDADANSANALFHQAVAVYQQDRLLDSAKLFERFLAQNASHQLATDARENLSLCYRNTGDFAAADATLVQYANVGVPSRPAADSGARVAEMTLPAPKALVEQTAADLPLDVQ